MVRAVRKREEAGCARPGGTSFAAKSGGGGGVGKAIRDRFRGVGGGNASYCAFRGAEGGKGGSLNKKRLAGG